MADTMPQATKTTGFLSITLIWQVIKRLDGYGAPVEAACDVAKALVVNEAISPVDSFVKRIMRVQSPLHLELGGAK